MEQITGTLGTGGPQLSAVGLGCMGMSHTYGKADDAESIRTIAAALDAGAGFLDTADFYGTGHNEELIGKAISGRREQAFLSVKTGVYRRPGANGHAGFGKVDASPDYLRNAVLYSLQRLKTDYIDLYTPARIDPQVPIAETVGALAELVQQGLVRYIGLSEASAGNIIKAHSVHPIAAVQTEYSIWSRGIEQEILPVLKENGIALVAYSPLSRGLLTGAITSGGQIRDARSHMPRFQGENLEHNLQLLEKIKSLAAAKGCTPAQLAISWVLAQGENIFTIPGTKKVSNLLENLAAAQYPLTPEDLRAINAIAPAGAAAGERYPPQLLQQLEV